MIVESAFGRIAVVSLDEPGALHADEVAHAETLSPYRAREWLGGRTALRQLVATELPILSNERGAPILPPGFVGSVSHKGGLAAALLADDDGWRVGLDLEVAAPPRADIAPRILTARELAALPDRGRAVTLRFAIKEAIYKAVDPFVQRYVAFKEVELDFDPAALPLGGAAREPVRVTSALGFEIEASWLEHDGHWLAVARARRP